MCRATVPHPALLATVLRPALAAASLLSFELQPALAEPSPTPPLTFEAILEPDTAVAVRAQRAGIVMAVRTAVGDSVAAGDTLVELDDRLLRLGHAAAQLVSQQAGLRLERFRTLRAEGLIAAQELEQVEFEARNADLRLEQATWELAQAVVTAPLRGQVSDVSVAAGAHVSAGEPCLTVVDARDLLAEVFVPVDQLAHVHLGQSVTAALLAQPLPASPDLAIQPSGTLDHSRLAPLRGRISRLAPTVDPATGCCLAVAAFPRGGLRHLPGTVVQVRLVGE